MKISDLVLDPSGKNRRSRILLSTVVVLVITLSSLAGAFFPSFVHIFSFNLPVVKGDSEQGLYSPGWTAVHFGPLNFAFRFANGWLPQFQWIPKVIVSSGAMQKISEARDGPLLPQETVANSKSGSSLTLESAVSSGADSPPATNVVVENITAGIRMTALAYDPLGGYVFAAEGSPGGSDQILKINDLTNTVVGEFTPTCANCTSDIESIIVAPNGLLYAGDYENGVVYVINASSDALISTITGLDPYRMALDLNSPGVVYVSDQNAHEINIISGTSVIGELQLTSNNSNIQGIAYDQNNSMLYLTDGSTDISAINSNTTNQISIAPDCPSCNLYGIAYDSANGNLYAGATVPGGNGSIFVISTQNDDIIASDVLPDMHPATPVLLSDLLYDPGDAEIYANDRNGNYVVALNTTTNTVGYVTVSSNPSWMTFDYWSGNLYTASYTNSTAGIVSLIATDAATALTNLTFSESGLPQGISWNTTVEWGGMVDGLNITRQGTLESLIEITNQSLHIPDNITFFIPRGYNYSFRISNVSLVPSGLVYVPSLPGGSISDLGPYTLPIPLTFGTYSNVIFEENGLQDSYPILLGLGAPGGSGEPGWNLTLDSCVYGLFFGQPPHQCSPLISGSSSGPYPSGQNISFVLPNATYVEYNATSLHYLNSSGSFYICIGCYEPPEHAPIIVNVPFIFASVGHGVIDAFNDVYVADPWSNSVDIYDSTHLTGSVTVGNLPIALAQLTVVGVSTTYNLILSLNQGSNSLTVFSAATGIVYGSVEVGLIPVDILSKGGYAITVPCGNSQCVLVSDYGSNQISAISIGYSTTESALVIAPYGVINLPTGCSSFVLVLQCIGYAATDPTGMATIGSQSTPGTIFISLFNKNALLPMDVSNLSPGDITCTGETTEGCSFGQEIAVGLGPMGIVTDNDVQCCTSYNLIVANSLSSTVTELQNPLGGDIPFPDCGGSASCQNLNTWNIAVYSDPVALSLAEGTWQGQELTVYSNQYADLFVSYSFGSDSSSNSSFINVQLSQPPQPAAIEYYNCPNSNCLPPSSPLINVDLGPPVPPAGEPGPTSSLATSVYYDNVPGGVYTNTVVEWTYGTINVLPSGQPVYGFYLQLLQTAPVQFALNSIGDVNGYNACGPVPVCNAGIILNGATDIALSSQFVDTFDLPTEIAIPISFTVPPGWGFTSIQAPSGSNVEIEPTISSGLYALIVGAATSANSYGVPVDQIQITMTSLSLTMSWENDPNFNIQANSFNAGYVVAGLTTLLGAQIGSSVEAGLGTLIGGVIGFLTGTLAINSLAQYPIYIFTITPSDTSPAGIQNFAKDLKYYFDISVTNGYFPEEVMLIHIPIVEILNTLTFGIVTLPTTQGSIGTSLNVDQNGVDPLITTSPSPVGGELDFAVTFSTSNQQGINPDKLANTAGDYISFLKSLVSVLESPKLLAGSFDALQVATGTDVTINDITSGIIQSQSQYGYTLNPGILSSYIFLDTANFSNDIMTNKGLPAEIFNVVNLMADTFAFISSLLDATASGFTDAFADLGAIADFVGFANDAAADISSTICGCVGYGGTLAYEIIDSSSAIVSGITDPNGTTLVPAVYSSNGQLLLGYNAVDGTMIMRSQAGYIEDAPSKYLLFLYENRTEPIDYNVTYYFIGSNASFAPYYTYINNPGYGFGSVASYTGVIQNDSSLSLSIGTGVNATTIEQRYLWEKVSVIESKRAGQFTVYGTPYLVNGNNFTLDTNISSMYSIVNGTTFAMSRFNSTSYSASFTYLSSYVTPVFVYGVAPGVPGGFGFGILPASAYTVTFAESGLLPGTSWNATLNGETESFPADNSLTHNSITFVNIPAGTYSWEVSSPVIRSSDLVDIATGNGNGTVTVSSSTPNVVLNVTYTPQYNGAVGVGASPQGVAYDPINQQLYIANRGNDSISIINSSTNQVVNQISLKGLGGTGPIGIAYDNCSCSDDMYVTLDYGGVIALSSSVSSPVLVPVNGTFADPIGIAFDPANNDMYVTNLLSNYVSVISSTSNAVITKIILPDPEGGLQVTYDPVNNDMYVTNEATGNVSVIDSSTNEVVNTINVGTSASGIAYDGCACSGDLYVSDNLGVTALSSNALSPTLVNTTCGCGAFGMPVFDPVNNEMYFFGKNNLTIINSKDNTVMGSIAVGNSPEYAVFDPSNNFIYVTDSQDNSVSFVGATSFTITSTVKISNPTYEAYDPANGFLYVTNGNLVGEVSALNTATNEVTKIAVGLKPLGIAYDSDNGFIYVANQISNTVSVINGTKILKTIKADLLGPTGVAYDSSNNLIYVTNYGNTTQEVKTVTEIQGTTVVGTIKVGSRPFGITVNSGNVLVANSGSGTISFVNITSNLVTTSKVGGHPNWILFDPADSNYWVTDQKDNSTYLLSYVGGGHLKLEMIIQLGAGSGPLGLAYDSENQEMFVSNSGSNNIYVFNNLDRLYAVINVGKDPIGVVLDSTNNELYVADQKSHTLSLIAS